MPLGALPLAQVKFDDDAAINSFSTATLNKSRHLFLKITSGPTVQTEARRKESMRRAMCETRAWQRSGKNRGRIKILLKSTYHV